MKNIKYLSKLVASLSESETIAMTRKSNELRAKGEDVISMSLGEPDFPTPDYIKEAAKKAIDDNYSHYAPVPGYLELREAIVEKFRKDNGLEFSPVNIMVSNGAKHSISNILLALLNPGDEVVLPAPYWVSYREMVKIAGGVNRIIHTSIKDDFKISAQQLDETISPKTKVLILNTPSNPSGSVYSEDELRGLAEIIRKHPGLFVISDEVYEHIIYEGRHFSLAQIPEIKHQVIVVNSVSKSYAMTGWRVGYMAGPEWLVSACSDLQGQVTSGANSVAQMAALAAITGPQDDTLEMRDIFMQRRDLIVKSFEQIPGVKVLKPGGAFYLFPDVSDLYGKVYHGRKINNSEELSWYLLEKALVATVPGTAFGTPECIRLSYATSEENIKEAMRRITEALM
ncbi:MAG: pyridoxal phosphate-dependent aminotransferase [Chlorobi bacterium]|nr:pyridoxal phosphate-dependent aminotransferase [Chlorobiota bacterium]